MRYFVYKTTNIINGKIYIGVHSSEVEMDNYLGSGTSLKRAIKKYGRNNFSRVNICECSTPIAMFEVEKHLVTPDFVKQDTNYNLVSGGGFWDDTVQTKQRNLRLGKTLSDEHKAKIGASSKGRKLSSEAKLKLSKAKKGKTFSEEHKANLAKSRANRIFTAETKQKMKKSKRIFPGWEYYDELFLLWLEHNKPKRGNFRLIAIANNFPDMRYDKMVSAFIKDEELK